MAQTLLVARGAVQSTVAVGTLAWGTCTPAEGTPAVVDNLGADRPGAEEGTPGEGRMAVVLIRFVMVADLVLHTDMIVDDIHVRNILYQYTEFIQSLSSHQPGSITDMLRQSQRFRQSRDKGQR